MDSLRFFANPACGKIVNSQWTTTWIKCAGVSPKAVDWLTHMTPSSVQPTVFHLLFRILPQALYTPKIAARPLSEHIFYPVSTDTYYKHHQIKFKER